MAQAVTSSTGAPGTRTGPLDVEMAISAGEGGVQALRRALAKFLVVPLAVLLGFLIVSILVYALDRANPTWIEPLRSRLEAYIFPQPSTTRDFMGAVTGGLLTQTSIVISMLLIVLQNTATNLGNLVYDQFMNRRRNQLYVGYVIGSATMVIFLLSTTSDSFNPVLGGLLTLIVMFFSVALLAWFLYTVMNQMKPQLTLSDIHDASIKARKNELVTLARTRQRSISPADVQVLLRSTAHGYVTRIDLDKIGACLKNHDPSTEVVIDAAIGDYVSYLGIVAQIRSHDLGEARGVAECVGHAFTLAREREPRYDPRFNLEQYEMVAWTAGSTSKHNPEVPLMVIHELGDLLRRWTLNDRNQEGTGEELAVVYPDRVIERAFDSLESTAIVTTESKQHQVYAEVLKTLAYLYRDLPPGLRDRADTLLCRVVPDSTEFVYSVVLEDALDAMVFTLRDVGNDETADMLAQARGKLAQTVGQVSSSGGGSGGGGQGGGGPKGSSSGSGGGSGKSD